MNIVFKICCCIIASYVIYLPTKKEKTRQEAWVPFQNEIHKRSGRYKEAQAEGTQKTLCLILFLKYMLPKSRKLRALDNFTVIFSGKKRFFGKYLSANIAKISGPSRFACVVSLKVSKKAVVRNKIRRRGYAAVRENMAKIRDGYGVMMIFKPEAVKVEFSELRHDILDVLSKAQVIQ